MSDLHSNETRITRNYDIIASGFSMANPTAPSEDDDKKFCWSMSFVKDIAALFSSITLSAIGYGMLVALIAFKVEKHIKSEILISISSAMQIAAGVFFARFLPPLARKIGMISSLYLASAISAVSAIILYRYINYPLWITAIFFLGTSLFICGVTRQTLMIDMAPPHMKAMMISIGGMLVAIGNSFGPALLNLLDTKESFASYAIAAAAYLLSMLPLSRLKKTEVAVKEEKRISVWRYIQASPKIMFAGFCVNYAVSSASAFLIIYGLKIGMSQSESSLLYSVLLFGTIFSIPLGYLTDLVNRRFLMITSTALSLTCVILLYFNQNHHQIYLLLFLTFGCMVGIKLPAIVLINEKYKPTQRLAVNAAFAKFSLMGNIVGIFSTGAIMRAYGAKGLWLSLSFILSFYLVFCSVNYIIKAWRGELNFRKFSLGDESKMEG